MAKYERMGVLDFDDGKNSTKLFLKLNIHRIRETSLGLRVLLVLIEINKHGPDAWRLWPTMPYMLSKQ